MILRLICILIRSNTQTPHELQQHLSFLPGMVPLTLSLALTEPRLLLPFLLLSDLAPSTMPFHEAVNGGVVKQSSMKSSDSSPNFTPGSGELQEQGLMVGTKLGLEGVDFGSSSESDNKPPNDGNFAQSECSGAGGASTATRAPAGGTGSRGVSQDRGTGSTEYESPLSESKST